MNLFLISWHRCYKIADVFICKSEKIDFKQISSRDSDSFYSFDAEDVIITHFGIKFLSDQQPIRHAWNYEQLWRIYLLCQFFTRYHQSCLTFFYSLIDIYLFLAHKLGYWVIKNNFFICQNLSSLISSNVYLSVNE